MKKFAAGFLSLLLIVCIVAPCAFAGYDLPENISITAQAVYLVNLDTGIAVFEKNADEPRSIASLTKTMTALLLIENVPDLSGTLIKAERSLYVPPITGGHASHANILPGAEVDALSMLYAIMLPSGNEAAEAVGYYLGNGNLNNFYALMNARAADLGCKNTSFASTNGLIDMDEGNYSSARDLFLILQECWKHEIFRTVAGSSSYLMPPAGHAEPYTIRTTNAMLRTSSDVYRPYIKGVKTGSTEAAGRCLATAAVNENGETYLGITLGSVWEPDPVTGLARSFYDNAFLYDWIFDNFSVRPSIDTGSPVAEVNVDYSTETDTLMLYPADDLKTVLPNGSDELLVKSFDLPESVPAPVAMGDKIGTVTLTLNDSVVGTVDLIAGQDVQRNSFLYAVSRVEAFFHSLYFRVVCILAAIFLVGYGALTIWMFRRQQQSRRTRRPAGAQHTRRTAPPERPVQPPRPKEKPADDPLDFLDEDFNFYPPDDDSL